MSDINEVESDLISFSNPQYNNKETFWPFQTFSDPCMPLLKRFVKLLKLFTVLAPITDALE